MDKAYEFKLQCESAYANFLELLKLPAGRIKDYLEADEYEIVGETFIEIANKNEIFEIKIDHKPQDNRNDSKSKPKVDKLKMKTNQKKKYECYICTTKFTSKKATVAHMKGQHGFEFKKPKPQKVKKTCNVCDKIFADHSCLIRHHRRVHLKEKIKSYFVKKPCEICGRMFSSRHSRNRHVNVVHKAEKRYACTVCGLSFGQGTQIKNHMLSIHSEERNYKCEQCPSTFKLKSTLLAHEITHMPKDERIIRRSRYIQRKERQPKKYDDKRIMCEICGRSIVTSGMEGHMRTHDGLKPYECATCRKCFGTKQQRNMHSYIHTNVRRFKCSSCEKTFRSCSNLNQHRKQHIGVKSYKCPFCDKAFLLPYSLRLHKRIHTGEKPYYCILCAETFSNSGAFRRHVTTLHPDEQTVAITKLSL